MINNNNNLHTTRIRKVGGFPRLDSRLKLNLVRTVKSSQFAFRKECSTRKLKEKRSICFWISPYLTNLCFLSSVGHFVGFTWWWPHPAWTYSRSSPTSSSCVFIRWWPLRFARRSGPRLNECRLVQPQTMRFESTFRLVVVKPILKIIAMRE